VRTAALGCPPGEAGSFSGGISYDRQRIRTNRIKETISPEGNRRMRIFSHTGIREVADEPKSCRVRNLGLVWVPKEWLG